MVNGVLPTTAGSVASAKAATREVLPAGAVVARARPTGVSVRSGRSPSSFSAATGAGSWRAFEKTSYVDPLDITITSVTTNLAWSGDGRPASSGGHIVSSLNGDHSYAVPYQFAWDNWSSSGVSFAWSGCIGCSSLGLRSADTFHNTDFELVVVAIMGVAGYAACGWNGNPANFYLAPTTTGYPNGYYGWSHSSSVSGGCSNLVHFRENHGGGFSS